MRLKYQFFISLLLVSALLIALMYVLNSWSFNRGFLGYLNSVEAQKLDSVVEELSDEYRATGGWGSLISDRKQWRSLNQQFPARGSNRRRHDNRASEHGPQRRTLINDDESPPPGRTGRGPPRQPRLILAGTDKQILIGPSRLPEKMVWRPVLVDEVTVAYIGVALRNGLTDELDKVFAAQQNRSYALAALAMVLVSAILAIFMSSRLVKPIVGIQRAVSDISRGNFAHRVALDRRDELGELGRDVNQLAFTLEENLVARQQSFAEISHELRTPVAVLQGEIEAMQDGIKKIDVTSIASLHGETLRLSHLINDLHELSLMDVGSLNYQMIELDINELLRSRLSAAQQMLDEKRIEVQLDNTAATTQTMGDVQRLGQLFDNLLQNSIRYTSAGGKIEISLSSDERYLKLNWEDSAPGVMDEQLPHIFESLYRTEQSRSRESGGSGLGLAIAKKIVYAHQGVIAAEHSKLGGLCISLQLLLVRGVAT